jgi:F0F1-type ATP synthase assembly protein I
MAWRLVGIGWYVPLCLVSGAFIGYKLDERFDTSPWLAFAGVTVGLVVALLGIYIMIRPLLKEEDERKDKNRE